MEADGDNVWPDAWADEGEVAEDGAAEGVVYEDGDAGYEEEAAIEGVAEAQGGEEYEDGDIEVVPEEYEEAGSAEGVADAGMEEAVGEDAVAEVQGAQRHKGLIFQVGGKTGNMLIRCFPVLQAYGSEAVIIKAQYPDCKLGDRVVFQAVAREGQRPLATEVKVVGHVDPELIGDPAEKGRGKEGKAKGKSKGRGGEGKGKGNSDTKGKGKGKASRTTYYAGVVKQARQDSPARYLIDCPQIYDLFGENAWFPANELPATVRPGGFVVFSVFRTCQALGVAKLELSPQILGFKKGAGKAKGARKGATKGVRRTIAKEVE